MITDADFNAMAKAVVDFLIKDSWLPENVGDLRVQVKGVMAATYENLHGED